MADSGINAAFTFVSTTYDADDCLQTTGINRSHSGPQYQCNGVMKTGIGAKSYVFNYSMAISKTDTTRITNLDETSTGAFTYWPGGNAAGRIKMTSTRAVSMACNIGAEANGIITIDGTLNLDDLTTAAQT